MVPIFREQFREAIGQSINELHERFEEICMSHLREGRAHAFGLIFYGWNDTEIPQAIEETFSYVVLDRLCGKKLSMFHLNMDEKLVTEYFNSRYLGKFGLRDKVKLPCIVFFKMLNGEKTDVLACELGSLDSIQNGFDRVHAVIENYVNDL
jgi:hypothetical protein